ncbi:MAG: iron ABC transporter permease [Halomonas sp.]|nr:iron ABC transporter permease [Halomonas sp.]MBR2514210.1 iron ABC transporter permease [Halomonas sp.]
MNQALQRMRQRLMRPHIIVGLVVLVILSALVIVPVAEILFESFRLQDRDVRRFPGAEAGQWVLFYWERVLASSLSQRIFYGPLINTMIVTVCFTFLAMLLGVALAWLVARTDMPFKALISASVVLPYILPAWTIALAWTTLFRTDSQTLGAAGFLQTMTGMAVPDWVTFGLFPITIVMVINYYAYAFLLTTAALSSMNRQLEEAAMMHGASLWTIIRRVNLPLVLPALVSSFVLTFATGLGAFGVPYLLGLPADVQVMATYLYTSTTLGRYGDAYVLTVILIAMAGITILLTSRLVGLRQSFATMTGKAGSSQLIPLGRYRRVIGIAVVTAVGIPAFLPLGLMALQSLQSGIGNFTWDGFTLDYWIGKNIRGFDGVLVDSRMLKAIWNTFFISFVVGVISVIAAFASGYAVAKGRGSRMATLIEQVAFIPYLVPGVALGAVFLAMFAAPIGPLPSLYGTTTLLILACFVSQLPFAVRSGTTAMMQIAGELEEAGSMHTRSWLTIARRILIPLAKRGLLVAFVLTFISTAKELNLVIMLVTPRTEMLSTVAIGFMDLAMEQFANAIALILVAITLLGALVAKAFSGDRK